MALKTTSYSVEHPEWGRIHVTNRRCTDIDRFSPDRIVVMQHGATYGSTAFNLTVGGNCWMDHLARCGFDTWCLDLPGYGHSERPAQMSQPASENPPFMRTADAASCLGSVIDFVRQQRSVDSVHLIGWSWGTAIASTHAIARAATVNRLVLFAPVWDRSNTGPSPIHVDGALGAYRTVSRDATRQRRQAGLAEKDRNVVMPAQWFDQWWQETAATDPASDGTTVRAPNGVVLDGIEYWNAGKPVYNPAAITSATMVAVGEWDNDTPPPMAHRVFELLTNTESKQLCVIGGGTHTLLMERNREQLFGAVQQFLEAVPEQI